MASGERRRRSILRAIRYRVPQAAMSLYMRLLGLVRRDSFAPVMVDPQQVARTVSRDDSTLKRSSTWHFGSVRGGDWDLDGYPVETYGLMLPILRKRVDEGRPFEEIQEYRENLAYIESGGRPDNCRTVEEYAEKWLRIEALYREIAEHGYKSQAEMGTKRPYDEVRMQIARDGELLLEEGIHRFTIARALGLERIPVIITRTHRDYDGGAPPALRTE